MRQTKDVDKRIRKESSKMAEVRSSGATIDI